MIRYLAYTLAAIFKSKSRLVAENLCLRQQLIVVKPDTVIRWHRKGWKAYWRWRSSRSRGSGRKRIDPELRILIHRMARENPLWGQRRIQAELARLGFKVSARTVARYMRHPYDGLPSPGWRQFLTQHSSEIWACGLSTDPPRFLIHDRDSSFGAAFDRRVESLGAQHPKRMPGSPVDTRPSAPTTNSP